MLQNMVYPLGLTYVIGLILFFWMPSWYVNYKIGQGNIWNSTGFYEIMRLSSFWTHPYFVGYSSLFVIVYILNLRILYGVKRDYYFIILIISFLALIFAQQRVSIALVLLFLDAFNVYEITPLRLIVLGAVVIIVLLPFFSEISLKDITLKRRDKE